MLARKAISSIHFHSCKHANSMRYFLFAIRYFRGSPQALAHSPNQRKSEGKLVGMRNEVSNDFNALTLQRFNVLTLLTF